MHQRRLLTALAGLTLSGALLTGVTPLTTPPEAVAMKRHPTYTGSNGDNVSAATQKKLNISDRMYAAGARRNSRYLNYQAANAKDAGNATLRRNFAAGWVIGGGSLKHVSTSERKAVQKIVNAHYAHKGDGCTSCIAPGPAIGGSVLQAPDPGDQVYTGSNTKKTYFSRDKIIYEVWVNADWNFNSCQTDDLIYQFSRAGIIAGIVAAVLAVAVVGIVPGLVAAIAAGLLAMTALEFDYRQKKSRVNATRVEVRYDLYTQLKSQ